MIGNRFVYDSDVRPPPARSAQGAQSRQGEVPVDDGEDRAERAAAGPGSAGLVQLRDRLGHPAAADGRGALLVAPRAGTGRAPIRLEPVPAVVPRLGLPAPRRPPAPEPAAGRERQGMTAGTVTALRDSLARGEIGVHYQPVVRLRDRRPVMVEALARWHGPGEAVPPDSFVPLAERNGLVRPLSASVAGRAASELAPLWPRLRLGVSLNLPLALLLQPDLPGWLASVLGRRGLGPRNVSLELTETTPVRDVSQLARALRRLAAAGFRVLLDDVTLRDGRDHLHALPFAGLKLDRSLVERLPGEARCRQEVRRLVRRAAMRGQVVIAEGVSERRLWSMLRGLGVQFAQGFAVGRPVPAGELAGWWEGWRGGWQD